MSQENVGFVRNFYAVHNRGNAEFWDLLPPDFTFDFSRRPVNPVILHRDAARAEFDHMRHEIFKEGRFGLEPEELIDAGDKVLGYIMLSGRGKSGDVVVSSHAWTVWTFRDGKPVEWTFFGHHREEALEAAGLSE